MKRVKKIKANKRPAYLSLSEKELKKRGEAAYELLKHCSVCPRQCGVNRLAGEKGFCQVGALPVVSSFFPHFGEEACLIGRFGSGTIFFTHCNLACVYCQNYDISQLGYGQEVSIERLAEMMVELQKLGCHNINFVTPTPQVPFILTALPLALEQGLRLPLVYNTNAYDSPEMLGLLDGVIDIYMPDAKYADDNIASRYSSAPRYFQIMKSVIKEMHRQVGDLKINKDGIAERGLLVRHLVLPNNLAGTKKIMQFLAKEISPNTFVNIMNQYHPCYKAFQFSELNRGISAKEYQEAREAAISAGLKRVYPRLTFLL